MSKKYLHLLLKYSSLYASQGILLKVSPQLLNEKENNSNQLVAIFPYMW